MNFKTPVFFIVFLSLFIYSNSNNLGEIARKTGIDEAPVDKYVPGTARDKRESSTAVDEQEYDYEYESDNDMDYYDNDIEGDELDEDSDYDYVDLYEYETPEQTSDYDGEDYYHYDGDEDPDYGDEVYEDPDEDFVDYEYNVSDWEDNDYSPREIEYDEYENDEGQMAEDMELGFRKRRATKEGALVCNNDKERDIVNRISSLQQTLIVLQNELNSEQNNCQTTTTKSVTKPTTTTPTTTTVRATTVRATVKEQKNKANALPVCKI